MEIMNNNNFCQSCSMPLNNPELLGTEKDGSKSREYCAYCYQHGEFLNPAMTLNEMKTLVKGKMTEMKIDNAVIDMAVSTLPNLKRWKNMPVAL